MTLKGVWKNQRNSSEISESRKKTWLDSGRARHPPRTSRNRNSDSGSITRTTSTKSTTRHSNGATEFRERNTSPRSSSRVPMRREIFFPKSTPRYRSPLKEYRLNPRITSTRAKINHQSDSNNTRASSRNSRPKISSQTWPERVRTRSKLCRRKSRPARETWTLHNQPNTCSKSASPVW